MDEHHNWYNGSVWHIDWPYQLYVSQWPIFYGPAMSLHILKTIWWRNVVLGIMDQCDSKDWPCKIYVGQWPIFHGPLVLPYIIVIDKLFLYIKKWHWPGVFVPLRALALVTFSFSQGAVASIMSYKWLPLMYQLAARMDVKPQRDTSAKFLPILNKVANYNGFAITWTASSEFGTYRLCEQRRLRRACASAQSRQNLRCSLIQAVSREEPSDRKPDPWLLWMAGHAQLKFVITECSKTQIRLTGLTWSVLHWCTKCISGIRCCF